MPRLKRSEKRAQVKPETVVVAPPTRVTERLFSAHCPVCGRGIPKDRAIKIGYVTVDRINYFGSIDWDPNKPFGVSFAAGGRGSFKDNEPIGPEQAPELFDAVKQRFLQALGEWVNKNWISLSEIEESISLGKEGEHADL